jgi:phosphatidylserine/phosphatidylglycerophosphate/cardiolipin synthase-like enzyme
MFFFKTIVLILFLFSSQGIVSKENKWKKFADKHLLGNAKSVICNQKFYKGLRKGQISPLMKSLKKDVQPYLKKGPIPEKFVYSNKNFVSLDVFRNNNAIFRMGQDMIENAQKEILIQTFLFGKQSIPVQLVAKGILNLEKRLKKNPPKKPIRVKIIVDKLTGILGFLGILPFGLYEKFNKDTDYYSLTLKKEIDPKLINIEIKSFGHTLLGGNHTKTIIVDRSKGLVTGANMYQTHDNVDGNVSDRADHGFMIMGGVTQGLTEDFYYAWKRGSKEVTNGNWTSNKIEENDGKVPFKMPEVVRKWALGKFLEQNVPMAVFAKKSVNVPVIWRSDDPVDQAYLSIIKNAKDNINIITPQFNAKKIIDALVNALGRGVEVRLLLSRQFQDEVMKYPGSGGKNSDNVEYMVKKWLKLKKKSPKTTGSLTIRWYVDRKGRLSRQGDDAKGIRKYSSHTKFLMADNQVTFVGSFNIDQQSWYFSRELILALDHHELSKLWCQKVFRTDFLRGKLYEDTVKLWIEMFGH